MIELPKPEDYELNLNIVSTGGGTGQFQVIDGLKKINNPHKLFIGVPPSDSGGGSGKAQRDLEKVGIGILPTGDARQASLALMSEIQQSREYPYYTFRFPKGTDLENHNPVNLEFTALELIYGSQEEAIRAFMLKHNIPGRIVPSSPKPAELVAVLKNGEQIVGEHLIDTRYIHKLHGKKHWTNPIDYIKFSKDAVTTLSLIEAVRNADLFISAPGDLYTSLLANFLSHGLSSEVAASKARKVICMNIFTKPGETDFGKNGCYTASDHLRVIGDYLDLGCIDAVVLNNTEIPEAVKKQYSKKNQRVVANDITECKRVAPNAKIIEAPVGYFDHRVLAMRHDADALADTILSVVRKSQ